MTEKNTFAYKPFLSLNISDFNNFYVKTATPLPPLKKVTSLFPSNSPLKVEALSSSLPLFENWLEVQPPPPPLLKIGGGSPPPPPPPLAGRVGRVHTMTVESSFGSRVQ